MLFNIIRIRHKTMGMENVKTPLDVIQINMFKKTNKPRFFFKKLIIKELEWKKMIYFQPRIYSYYILKQDSFDLFSNLIIQNC